ncbi:MAG: hypothetical protein ABEI86_11445 [Halobacteriaceae archaeon]
MTEVGDNTQPAMTYPSKDQYARWKSCADDRDMSVSEFMQSMIEAGLKVDQGFELSLDRDESTAQLREQRNDLKRELDRARDRIQKLENRLHETERMTVEDFIEENPGATHAEITQHLIDTAPERVVKHLEALEGDSVLVEDGKYYPANKKDSQRS